MIDTPFPLRIAATWSLSYFCSGVQNTQICLAWADLSTVHSSLQIVLSKSSAVQFFLSNAQATLPLALASVNFGLFLASHLHSLFSWRYRSNVLKDTWGQQCCWICSLVHVGYLFTHCTIALLSCLLSFFGLPDLGAFSIYSHTAVWFKKFLIVVQGQPDILEIIAIVYCKWKRTRIIPLSTAVISCRVWEGMVIML